MRCTDEPHQPHWEAREAERGKEDSSAQACESNGEIQQREDGPLVIRDGGAERGAYTSISIPSPMTKPRCAESATLATGRLLVRPARPCAAPRPPARARRRQRHARTNATPRPRMEGRRDRERCKTSATRLLCRRPRWPSPCASHRGMVELRGLGNPLCVLGLSHGGRTSPSSPTRLYTVHGCADRQARAKFERLASHLQGHATPMPLPFSLRHTSASGRDRDASTAHPSAAHPSAPT